jgi:hypothetical protein
VIQDASHIGNDVRYAPSRVARRVLVPWPREADHPHTAARRFRDKRGIELPSAWRAIVEEQRDSAFRSIHVDVKRPPIRHGGLDLKIHPVKDIRAVQSVRLHLLTPT